MEDQFSKREAQLDTLPQSLYVHQTQVRAIGETMVAQTPIYNTPIADAVACGSSLDDDEMIHWLQYPTEDLMDRNYCSDIFGELPISTFRITPETSVGKIGQAEEQFMAHAATMNASVEAEAAMELGFGRAIGLVKQPGLEAFTKVRTTVQPSISSSSQHNLSSPQSLNKRKEDLPPTFSLSHSRLSPSRSYPFNLRPRASLPPIDSCQINFPLFSLPAATDITKCSSGVISHIERQGKYSTKGVIRTDVSTAESTTLVGQQPSKLCKEPLNRHSYASGFTQNQGNQSGNQGNQGGYSSSHQHCSKVADAQKQRAECKSEQKHLVICQNSATAGSASDISTKCRLSPPLEDSAGFTDLTLTTSWGGSGNLSKPCWKTHPSTLKQDPKNDSRDMDVSTDWQSEDAGESTDLKKQANGRGSTKRNRAAEVHNLSERRRRDRINEKLKALQELIPNSDKSDKASILDEAIEYVKALQNQIQMMFLRSGIAVPATILPKKMQHLQMPQVTPLPHLRMGIGLGMGIGIETGFPNFATTTHPTITGHPTIPLRSLTGASSIANAASLHANNPFQSSGVVVDNCRGCSEHQPLQIPSQPLNINLWNAYMMHQPHHCQSHQGNQQNHDTMSLNKLLCDQEG